MGRVGFHRIVSSKTYLNLQILSCKCKVNLYYFVPKMWDSGELAVVFSLIFRGKWVGFGARGRGCGRQSVAGSGGWRQGVSGRRSRLAAGLMLRGLVVVLEPAGIGEVAVGDAFDLAGDEVGRNIFDLTGRYAAVNGARLHLCPFRNDGSRGDDGILTYFCIVHDDGAHADEHPILYGAAVDDGIVTDGHVVADDDTRFFIRAMDDDTILDIHFVADADAVDISADDCVEPDAAVVAHLHIAHDGCIRCDKTIFSKAWGLAFHR